MLAPVKGFQPHNLHPMPGMLSPADSGGEKPLDFADQILEMEGF